MFCIPYGFFVTPAAHGGDARGGHPTVNLSASRVDAESSASRKRKLEIGLTTRVLGRGAVVWVSET